MNCGAITGGQICFVKKRSVGCRIQPYRTGQLAPFRYTAGAIGRQTLALQMRPTDGQRFATRMLAGRSWPRN